MGLVVRCDLCGDRDEVGNPVLRLNVTRTTNRNGRTNTRGAGSIYLCRKCWEETCRPRTRAARAKTPKVELVA